MICTLSSLIAAFQSLRRELLKLWRLRQIKESIKLKKGSHLTVASTCLTKINHLVKCLIFYHSLKIYHFKYNGFCDFALSKKTNVVQRWFSFIVIY